MTISIQYRSVVDTVSGVVIDIRTDRLTCKEWWPFYLRTFRDFFRRRATFFENKRVDCFIVLHCVIILPKASGCNIDIKLFKRIFVWMFFSFSGGFLIREYSLFSNKSFLRSRRSGVWSREWWVSDTILIQSLLFSPSSFTHQILLFTAFFFYFFVILSSSKHNHDEKNRTDSLVFSMNTRKTMHPPIPAMTIIGMTIEHIQLFFSHSPSNGWIAKMMINIDVLAVVTSDLSSGPWRLAFLFPVLFLNYIQISVSSNGSDSDLWSLPFWASGFLRFSLLSFMMSAVQVWRCICEL